MDYRFKLVRETEPGKFEAIEKSLTKAEKTYILQSIQKILSIVHLLEDYRSVASVREACDALAELYNAGIQKRYSIAPEVVRVLMVGLLHTTILELEGWTDIDKNTASAFTDKAAAEILENLYDEIAYKYY